MHVILIVACTSWGWGYLMSDGAETPGNAAQAAPAQSKKDEPISLSKFLETVAPSTWRIIPARLWEHVSSSGGGYARLSQPPLVLHCTNEICRGPRTFRANRSELIFSRNAEEEDFFMEYLCSNCQTNQKHFSVQVRKGDRNGGQIYKYGEEPAFGPPTPPRLIRLFQGDEDLFFKGRRCESQGLGIGAFVYYRRIVESHKKQIFEQIIKVAEEVGIPKDQVATLKRANEEIQFSRAVEAVKDAFPATLLIKGQNPLTLLHGALSSHLHEKSDDECLALAQDVRIVLVELADKLGSALKDDAELNEAVKRLVKARS
jgi:hypothetical protein